MIVLGVDAAWTPHHASGVAVVTGEPGAWTCRSARSCGLAEVMEIIAGTAADVAAVDMPLARVPITARRRCDNLLTSAFVRYGLGVHSATPERPGAVSTEMMSAFERSGYELAVGGTPRRTRQVIEVYPHVAVMRLLGADYRVPYKVGRTSKYWPEASAEERKKKVRANLSRILRALKDRIGGIALRVPGAPAGPAELKRFEDALDAIVCAWIGTRYLEGASRAYGDENSSIWVPEQG